jgi:general secretion pathway protein A
MYLDHFQLSVKPFQITSDPKFLWLGEKHKEALATLRYGIMDNRGFLLLTGEVGTGKTLLINRLITMLDQDTIVATLPDPNLNEMDFFNLLANGFKMNRTFDSKGSFLIHLRDFLYQSHANNKQVLLIVDECQRLTHELMELIRILSNIDLHDRKLINIFLVGQQEFNAVLAASQNRALAQRISVRYHITPLEPGEISNYIFHRLRVAGGVHKIFTPAAISQVYYFSGGIPRLINILCDHALLTAYAGGAKQVDSKMILECAQELRIPLLPLRRDDNNTPAGVSDSKSIIDAAARNTRDQSEPATEPKKDPNGDGYKRKSQRHTILRILLYAGTISLLTLLAVAVVTHFSSRQISLWQTGAQTQYANSTQNEDETNSTHLQNGMINEPFRETIPAQPSQDASNENSAVQAVVQEFQTNDPTHNGLTQDVIEPLTLAKEKKIIVRFAFNSSEIEGDSFPDLDRMAAYLVQHPEEHIRILGHTDSSGSSGYNESISRFRASVVKSYLVGKGVSNGQITTIAVGDTQPIASNASSEGRNLNRRVEVEFVPAADL